MTSRISGTLTILVAAIAFLSPQVLLADAKVSQYPSGGTIQTTDQIPVVRDGSNYRVTVAPSAGTDTTDASHITSGTLPAARLPNPTSSSLGGVQSAASVSHQFLTGISTSGVPSLAQPSFGDVSGTATIAQGGTGVTAAQGNGTKVQLSTGTTTTNDCVKYDANGNTTDAGSPCGGSSINTVTPYSCSTSQALAYPANGNAAYDVTLTGNCTLTLTGGTSGQNQTVLLYLRQDATAGRTPTLPTGVKWPGGIAPTPNTTAGRVDMYRFYTPDGGTTIVGDY